MLLSVLIVVQEHVLTTSMSPYLGTVLMYCYDLFIYLYKEYKLHRRKVISAVQQSEVIRSSKNPKTIL